MKQIYHFSDQLGSVDCIPCAERNHSGQYSRDHIPTKALLNSPYPDNLMDVGMCQECNFGVGDETPTPRTNERSIDGSAAPDGLPS